MKMNWNKAEGNMLALIYYPDICLEELSKTRETRIEDIRCPEELLSDRVSPVETYSSSDFRAQRHKS
jgi:hypothetical protein